MNKKIFSTKNIIETALFATLIYVATQLFRIPLPAVVGAPFIHFGNAFVAFAALFLGFRRGAIAGVLGFLIFDCLNGYASEAPLIACETLLVVATYCLVWRLLFHQEDKPIYKIVLTVWLGVMVKIICTYFEGIITQVTIGASIPTAMVQSALSLYVTMINGIGTILIVSLFYLPLKKVLQRF